MSVFADLEMTARDHTVPDQTVSDRGMKMAVSAGKETRESLLAEADVPHQKRSFKRSFLKWSAVVLACLMVAFFFYRWAGTSHYKGTIQRVYEKEAEYRVEFTDLEGRVRVVGNRESRFPYFKVETADLHAELNRLANTGDLVEITVWGFRQAWFSMFPNVIEVEFLQSRKERERKRAERVAEAVLDVLTQRDALKKADDATREAVIDAVVGANGHRAAVLAEEANQ